MTAAQPLTVECVAKALGNGPNPMYAWLRAKGPEEIVGISCAPGHCPVKRFVKDTCQTGQEFEVSFIDIRRKPGDNQVGLVVPNPPWVKHFIRLVDAEEIPDNKVTASTCLTVLDRTIADLSNGLGS